jgi:hypothetical protein
MEASVKRGPRYNGASYAVLRRIWRPPSTSAPQITTPQNLWILTFLVTIFTTYTTVLPLCYLLSRTSSQMFLEHLNYMPY